VHALTDDVYKIIANTKHPGINNRSFIIEYSYDFIVIQPDNFATLAKLYHLNGSKQLKKRQNR
jgi:hypothetical protein